MVSDNRIDTKARNYEELRTIYLEHTTSINDLFIETQLAVRGLRLVSEEFNTLKRQRKQSHIRVKAPSASDPNRTIRRQIDNAIGILDERVSAKEYVQSLVFAISKFESYLSSSLNYIARLSEQLLISSKGKDKKGEAAPVVCLV